MTVDFSPLSTAMLAELELSVDYMQVRIYPL
jgi:hypothetical protein